MKALTTRGGVADACGALLALVLAFSVTMTWSRFSAARSHQGEVTSGRIQLTLTPATGPVVAQDNLFPGSVVEGCVAATNTSTAPVSEVRIYATTSGTMRDYVTATVERGTLTATDGSCSGFSPDGSGASLYNGPLTGLGSTYATGILDPKPSWAVNETHAYRFQFSLQDTAASQSTTMAMTMMFEARL